MLINEENLLQIYLFEDSKEVSWGVDEYLINLKAFGDYLSGNK